MSAETEKSPGKVHWRKRFNYAADAVEHSFTLPIFGVATAFVLIDHFFKIHDWLVKTNIIEEKYVNCVSILYGLLAIWLFRFFFLIAEQAGIRGEQLELLKAAQADEIAKLKAAQKARGEVFQSLHSVIHETRDCLLSEGKFKRLCNLAEGEHITKLYETISNQLGMMELAFQSLSGSRCSIVLKIIQKPANSDPILVSVCYGPSTPQERRNHSTVIPANQGIMHDAVVGKRIAYCNSVREDPRFWPPDQKENYANSRYQTIVACPVITNKVVCGVLCFDWKEPNMYCQELHEVLACFTDVVSLACYICHESRNVTVKAATTGTA